MEFLKLHSNNVIFFNNVGTYTGALLVARRVVCNNSRRKLNIAQNAVS